MCWANVPFATRRAQLGKKRLDLAEGPEDLPVRCPERVGINSTPSQ